jgi:hypothetical protein
MPGLNIGPGRLSVDGRAEVVGAGVAFVVVDRVDGTRAGEFSCGAGVFVVMIGGAGGNVDETAGAGSVLVVAGGPGRKPAESVGITAGELV